jgi:hypothetical protein
MSGNIIASCTFNFVPYCYAMNNTAFFEPKKYSHELTSTQGSTLLRAA